MALSEIKKNGDIRFVERQVGYFLEKKLVSRRDTLIYLEEMSSNISQEDKEAVLRGEKMLICLNTNGQTSRTFTASMLVCSAEQIMLTGK